MKKRLLERRFFYRILTFSLICCIKFFKYANDTYHHKLTMSIFIVIYFYIQKDIVFTFYFFHLKLSDYNF